MIYSLTIQSVFSLGDSESFLSFICPLPSKTLEFEIDRNTRPGKIILKSKERQETYDIVIESVYKNELIGLAKRNRSELPLNEKEFKFGIYMNEKRKFLSLPDLPNKVVC